MVSPGVFMLRLLPSCIPLALSHDLITCPLVGDDAVPLEVVMGGEDYAAHPRFGDLIVTHDREVTHACGMLIFSSASAYSLLMPLSSVTFGVLGARELYSNFVLRTAATRLQAHAGFLDEVLRNNRSSSL